MKPTAFLTACAIVLASPIACDAPTTLETPKETQKIGLEGHFEKLGVRDPARIKTVLSDNGVTDEQMQGALEGLTKVMYEMEKEGDAYEMHPKLRPHLENNVGLNADQITLIERLARRLSKRGQAKADARERRIADRYASMGIEMEPITQQLSDKGFSDEQITGAQGALLRLVHQANTNGPTTEIDPRLQLYFEEKLQLNAEQIKVLEDLAATLADANEVAEP